jgi:hypothetical protein
MLKWLLFFTIGFFSTLFAQEIVVDGRVLDSIGTPLVFASVVVKNLDTNTSTFTSSSETGAFTISVVKSHQYLIKVFYLGFENHEKEYQFLKSTSLEIVLQPSTTQLDEVTLNYEIPILVKKDTTTYKVDFFNIGDERKLKDVLANLPGIEVEANGNVLYKGVKIDKLLVDNKPFFNGATKLGVDNIPSDAIDYIDILENYNEIEFLKGLSNTETIALNVGLKEDKKNFVFGDLSIAEGNSNFGLANSNVFYYAPKVNINLISKFNNTGEEALSLLDYLQFTTRINGVFKEDFKLPMQEIQMFMNEEAFIKKNQKFGAFNFTKTNASKLSLSTFFIINALNTERVVEQSNTYVSFNESFNDNSLSNLYFMIGELKLDYLLAEKWRISSITNFKHNDTQEEKAQRSLTNIQDITNIFNSNLTSKPIDFNQHIELHGNLSSKHILSVFAGYNRHENIFNNNWQSNSNTFTALLPIVSQENIELQQLKKRTTDHFQLIFKHFWKFNNTHHLYTTFKNGHTSDYFSSQEEQILSDNSTALLTTNGFGNTIDYLFRDSSFKMIYKYKKGKLTASQGLAAHNYYWKTSQTAILENNKWLLLPEARLEFDINKSKKISVGYALKATFSDAANLANNFYLRSYNSVFRGNEALQNDLLHNLSLNYRASRLYRGEMFYAFLNYTKKAQGFVNAVQFQGPNQFFTRVLLEDSEESLSLNANFQKKLKNFRFSWNGSMRTSAYLQLINNNTQTNRSKSFHTQFTAETRFKKLPNLKAGLNTRLNEFLVNGNTSFVTSNYFGELRYTALKNFDFKTDYNLLSFINRSSTQKDLYESLNMSMLYQFEKSPWSIGFVGNNLLNVTYKRSNSFNPLLISDIRESVLPRVLLLSVGYKL